MPLLTHVYLLGKSKARLTALLYIFSEYESWYGNVPILSRADAHSQPSQIFKMEIFPKIVND